MTKISKGIFRGMDRVEASLIVLAALATLALFWAIYLNMIGAVAHPPAWKQHLMQSK